MPATESEFRQITGITGSLPPDISAVYATSGDVCDTPAQNDKKYGKRDAHKAVDDYKRNLFVRHDGYWYFVPPLSHQQLENYWAWFNNLDPETRYIIINSKYSHSLPDDLLNKILRFFPAPIKLSYWDSAYIWWHAQWTDEGNKEGATFGQYSGNPMGDLIQKYHKQLENSVAKEREQKGEWYHSWTNRLKLVTMLANPFNDNSEKAAAWDSGAYDGERCGYMLAMNSLPRIIHEFGAFEGIIFPSDEYAQIYNNAFAEALGVGYDRGQKDLEHNWLEEKMQLERFNTWTHAFSCFMGILGAAEKLAAIFAA